MKGFRADERTVAAEEIFLMSLMSAIFAKLPEEIENFNTRRRGVPSRIMNFSASAVKPLTKFALTKILMLVFLMLNVRIVNPIKLLNF